MTQLDTVQVDELVREIARALVDEPNAVAVEAVSRGENTVLNLRVAPQVTALSHLWRSHAH